MKRVNRKSFDKNTKIIDRRNQNLLDICPINFQLLLYCADILLSIANKETNKGP